MDERGHPLCKIERIESYLMPNLQYKHYLLGLLTVVAASNYLDRTVLSLLLEPIKQDLALNDSQLGLLTGLAFALFYAVAGIPIARWADRGNRNTVVSVTTALWSVMLALCGLVGNFTQLLLVRVGVAVGEAGCLPPAQSLIADYFDRAERPRAMAIYWMSYAISVIIGYLGGGWLVENFGWRITFMVIGLPGILLAILVKLTLREPRLKQKATIEVEQFSLKEVLNTLWQQHSFRHIVTAFCVGYFFGMGIILWMPTYFVRSHGMGASELGFWLAFSWGVCALFGGYLGGVLATRYAACKEALQMRAVAVVFVLFGLIFAMIYLSTNKYIALIFLAINGFLLAMCNGAIFSAIQSLVNDRMRSVAFALLFLMANLIGLGLGPLAVGVLSDLLMPMFGQESLRYALLLFTPGYLWLAFHYWKAGNTIEDDIKRVEWGEGLVEEEAAILDADISAVRNESVL